MSRAPRRHALPLLIAAALLGGGLASMIAGAIAGDEPRPSAEADPSPDRGEGRLRPSAETHSPPDDELHGGPELDTYLTDPAAGEAAAAGPRPGAVARRFGELWSNRGAERALLRAQRRELVGLSRGAWARELDRSYAEAIAAGGRGAASEGEVVAVTRAPAEGSGSSRGYLIITRERLLRGGEPLEPYRYATYLARLERRGGAWAVSSWEPQL